MSREELKNSGLLEQYVLGLTSRKEAELVESVLEADPEARAEYEKLREEFDGYVSRQGLNAPLDGRAHRSVEEFEDLDHEMIMAMMERNHTLSIWRYVMGAVVLLLLGLSGYLFRQQQVAKAELVNERAMHAQDNNSHDIHLRELEGETLHHVDTTAVLTHPSATESNGVVLLHQVLPDSMMLLDLSHAAKLTGGRSYFVYVADDWHHPVLEITSERQVGLHSLPARARHAVVRVYRWHPAERPKEISDENEHLIAALGAN